MSTVVRGLDNILSGGDEFLTFEEGKPKVLLFIDWYEKLTGVREHYEPSMNPKYIRCPGKDICPLCEATGKTPPLRVKFRAYDPSDNKVKIVSLAKTHIRKLNNDFNLDEVDPTTQYVTIYRSGKDANDTSYSARRYNPDPSKGRPVIPLPNLDELDMPDIAAHTTPHTPDEIRGFMNSVLASNQAPAPRDEMPMVGGYQQYPAYDGPQPAPQNQRRLPF